MNGRLTHASFLNKLSLEKALSAALPGARQARLIVNDTHVKTSAGMIEQES
ncbi:hypothetical protein [Lonsdalea quercina]|uniref:hypothetical protein n=1 Tax=Lonsdalea quercina TaxID=71657 RepID=UPI0039758C66